MYLTVFLAFPAQAQFGPPAPSFGPPTPSLPSPPATSTGPAVPAPGGIGLPGVGAQPFGFPGSSLPGTSLTPDSRPRVGSPGFPFDPITPAPEGQPRAWTVTPSIGISESYNDNVFFTSRNKQDDFITTITPGLFVTVDTARLRGTLNTAPSFVYYANNTSETSLTLNGNGQFLATFVPDFLFLQARGASSAQPLGSAFTTPQTQEATGRSNLVQTYSYSISPYAIYRFGGTATAFAGYVFQYVNQDTVGSIPTRGLTPLEQELQARFDSDESGYSANQGYAGVRTGEDFGPFAMQGSVSGTWYEGDGIYDGAYRQIALVETRYAFTPVIAGLVEFGYEREQFNTFPVTDIDGPVWALGTRLTPDPESLIIAKYGRRNGFDSFFFNGSWAVAGRTQLFGTYEEKLTTSALNAGDLLSTTTLDPLGNPIDAQTGAPVLPSIANALLGPPGVLFRQKVGTAGVSQSWPRDTVTLSLSYIDSVPYASTESAVRRGRSFATETTSIALTWGHELGPSTNLVTFGEYAMTTTTFRDTTIPGGGNDGNSISAGVTLVQQLRPGLSGAVSYRFNWRDSGVTRVGTLEDGEAVQNIFTAGLRQSF